MSDPKNTPEEERQTGDQNDAAVSNNSEDKQKSGSREIGGRKGPEPTRYGDWEKAGRCIDF